MAERRWLFGAIAMTLIPVLAGQSEAPRAGPSVLTGFSSVAVHGVVAANVSLLPVAADFTWTISETSFPVVSLRLSGGGAVMIVSAAYVGDPQTKIVPFALTGFVLDFPFASYLGLAIEANYVSFFEDSLWIMGFTPQASLYLRL